MTAKQARRKCVTTRDLSIWHQKRAEGAVWRHLKGYSRAKGSAA